MHSRTTRIQRSSKKATSLRQDHRTTHPSFGTIILNSKNGADGPGMVLSWALVLACPGLRNIVVRAVSNAGTPKDHPPGPPTRTTPQDHPPGPPPRDLSDARMLVKRATRFRQDHYFATQDHRGPSEWRKERQGLGRTTVLQPGPPRTIGESKKATRFRQDHLFAHRTTEDRRRVQKSDKV